MKIVPVGGRIKSAAVGLDVFSQGVGDNLQQRMRDLRKHPPRELLEAFFPSDRTRLRQMMEGIGFYRPVLKTDQGMGGNFLPFYIDPKLPVTNLSTRTIVREEGLAIPELYLNHDVSAVRELQEAFRKLNFREVDRILQPLLVHSREAEKGRTPFFLIRPAQLSSPIVFGVDIVEKVTKEVGKLLCQVKARAEEMAAHTPHQGHLYFLADVFITTDGEIAVERLHFPDVGFFMTELDLAGTIAEEVQGVVRDIRDHVFTRVLDRLDTRVVYIITRDEVLERSEDVLEILEIQSISRILRDRGFEIVVKSTNCVCDIPFGATCLLFNIPESAGLLERYDRRMLHCYPNPYLQLASREVTGLRESIVPAKHVRNFLGLTGCNPGSDQAAEGIVSQIDTLLTRHGGITSDYLHVEVDGRESIPVHRKIHHSWKRVANRVKDPSQAVLKIREIPLTSKNSMVTSQTGPRVHVFRFTFTAE